MPTESIKTKLKLGDIKINAYHLKDGSYAAPGLSRLYHTDIYRYGDSWYFLGNAGRLDLTNCKFWERNGDVFLAFQGSKLCYRYPNPVDPGSYLHVPIPCDINSAIEFCILGKLASGSTVTTLSKVLGQSCLLNKSLQNRLINSYTLLRDTAIRLQEAKVSTSDAKNKSKKSRCTDNKRKKSRCINNNLRNEHLTGIQGHIYLVKLDAHLKLGFTHSPRSRMESFKTASARVELIKLVKGTLSQEKRLHSRLGSKVRELYDFEDEQRILKAMDAIEQASQL